MFKRLFFDIETATNFDKLVFMPEPTAPGNLKDPEKIAVAIKEKKEDQINNAPLDPDYGRILCIGYACDVDVVPDVLSGDEAVMLGNFWNILGECGGRCVGYNILSFDLPYIMRRSIDLGVKNNISLHLAKYRIEPVTDLFGILYNWGMGKGLKQVAKLYGLTNNAPDVSGADVANMPIEQVIAYCASDVSLTQQLYARMTGVYFSLP